jgi:F420-non-reducing hydrogenase iron-sulfur subunit
MREGFGVNEYEPQVLAFACHYCAYAAADLAGSMRLSYPPNVKVLHLPCTGKLDIIYLLRAFEKGADAVFVAG